MYVFERYQDIMIRTPLCVALGNFDGVHMGHQKLISVLKYNAELFGTSTMVYTFSSHPRKITMPEKQICNITDKNKRTDILESNGIDYLFLEKFRNVMHMKPEQFVRKVLVDIFKVRCVVVGYNYRFGCQGSGTAEALLSYGEAYDFRVEVVPAVEINGHIVSSSLIRSIIRSGEVERVPLYLGRHFSLNGKVVHGKQNGTCMGIRTANIEIGEDITIPSTGVYITDTVVAGKKYKSVTNIGYNPTFKGSRLTIETHIIGFEANLYDNNIEIYFLKRLRDEIRFDSIDDLVNQIRLDINCRCNYE